MASKYVPPHLRGKKNNSQSNNNITPPTNWKKGTVRYKSIVVPMFGNKYVVVTHETGDITFPGGGCAFNKTKQKYNHKACALKELTEETRGVIKLNNLPLPSYQFWSNLRSNTERANNNKKGIKVYSLYRVYTVPVSISENYKNIFSKTKNNRTETTNISLMSLNNLRAAPKVYSIVRNNILPKLKANYRKTPNGRS
jgi:hypothetical protein